MNLKEKFKGAVEIPLISTELSKMQRIAEDFAIGFAKWFALHHTEEVFYEDNYTEEMLEKYKKEKGL